MGDAPSPEIERQYRVLRQTLSMHAMLRDHYAYRARVSEVVILSCSVVFCATTFAEDRLYTWLEFTPEDGQVVLGIASIAAFAASLTLILADWKGVSTKHRIAADKWSEVLRLYRQARSTDGTWLVERTVELDQAYWDASRNTTEIPEARFNRLKARYLLKVEISNSKSKYPGCPRWLLWFLIRARGTAQAIRQERTDRTHESPQSGN